jgi:hypothetical protein
MRRPTPPASARLHRRPWKSARTPACRAEDRRRAALDRASLPRVFDRLEFVYFPSRDVAADVYHFTHRVSAELVFAIEAFGTRVAMIRLSPDPPALLLAGHLEGDRPILVYRVPDLGRAIAELGGRGVEVSARFDIPHGPAAELASPGPQRLALFELTRPDAPERLSGRRDF